MIRPVPRRSTHRPMLRPRRCSPPRSASPMARMRCRLRSTSPSATRLHHRIRRRLSTRSRPRLRRSTRARPVSLRSAPTIRMPAPAPCPTAGRCPRVPVRSMIRRVRRRSTHRPTWRPRRCSPPRSASPTARTRHWTRSTSPSPRSAPLPSSRCSKTTSRPIWAGPSIPTVRTRPPRAPGSAPTRNCLRAAMVISSTQRPAARWTSSPGRSPALRLAITTWTTGRLPSARLTSTSRPTRPTSA